MAAHRIRAAATGNASLPRCRSEGTLIDLGESVSEPGLIDVKGKLVALADSDRSEPNDGIASAGG